MNNNVEKKGNGLLVFIAVLLIILIVMSGFMMYKIYQNDLNDGNNNLHENMNENDENSIGTEDDVNNIRALTEEEKSILMVQIDGYNKYFSLNYPIDNVSNLDNATKLRFASHFVVDGTLSSFSSKSLNEVINKYFGNSNSVIFEDIICSIDNEVLFKYNNTTKMYSFNNDNNLHGHGGEGYVDSYSHFLSGTYDSSNGIIVVNAHVLYGAYFEDTSHPITNYFVSATDAKNSTNSIYNLSEEEASNFSYNDVYSMVKNKLDVTTFTFKKDSDGNFGLEKISVE